MATATMRAWIGLLVVFGAGIGAAQQPVRESAPEGGDWQNPTFALATLQQAHDAAGDVFVVQNELDKLVREGGGGACASAAGIDLLQSLRAMAGLDPLRNPHRVVLASIVNQPDLLAGRVSNDQFVRLLTFYDEQHLDEAQLTVSVEPPPGEALAAGETGWSPTDGPNFDVAPSAIKVITFSVTERDGTWVGRHFVLLKERERDEITVLDPQRPTRDHRYTIAYQPGAKGPREHVFLRLPPGVDARGRSFEVHTIFKVAIAGAPGPRPNTEAALEDIKAKISQTASDLRTTEDFLSPRAWRARTAGFGLPALDLPVEFGGSGWPATQMLEVFRHAGRYNLNFRDVVGGAHVRPLLKSSDPEVLEIVRQVARGQAYIAIAITEPDVGSDVPSIKSTARKVAGGYLLSGTKRFNARLDQATHVIIFTQGTTGEDGKLSVFVLPIDTPGLAVERFGAHGLTGNSYGGLKFNDLFVPDTQLVGRDGEGLAIFFEHFLYWRLMQTAAAIGTGEDALQQMADRIKARHAFGGPIGRFTHLQQPIGQYTTELLMAHALAKDAAELIDRGEYRQARPLICGLKAEGVENALSAVDAAVRAFGGEGYSDLVDLGGRLRDLNGLRIADGTTDVMRMEVVRQTFGREFWEMAIENSD
jgi:alkylation response protein AidB-like acyl-CoA dehydrogenase